MMNKIKGYKAYNNMNDRFNNSYEIGKEYYIEGPIKFKERGFHFCKNLEDVFRYYNGFDENTVICEVEGFGEIDTYNDEYYGYYDMYASSNIKIIKVLSREEIIDIIINRNIDSIKRFISGFKLTEEEELIILNKFKEEIIEKYINYYQKNDEKAFTKKRS